MTLNLFWRRQTVLKSGTFQTRPARLNRLSTIPRLWRKARPNRHLMLRQNWIAASESVGWRPRLPVAGAFHCISVSSQTDSEPRALSVAL